MACQMKITTAASSAATAIRMKHLTSPGWCADVTRVLVRGQAALRWCAESSLRRRLDSARDNPDAQQNRGDQRACGTERKRGEWRHFRPDPAEQHRSRQQEQARDEVVPAERGAAPLARHEIGDECLLGAFE